LYYRLLKERPNLKWLNLRLLAENLLSADNQLAEVNYYTARVSARLNPDSPKKQQTYLDVLQTEPLIKVHFGNFQVHSKYLPICSNAELNGKSLFMPCPRVQNIQPWPEVVRVMRTEEKGSDVNLGVHLVRDACQSKFDIAAVITNDTDLQEPIRIVVQELGKTVGLLTPVKRPAQGLVCNASFVRRIRISHLRRSQFPNSVIEASGNILRRPVEWA